MSLNGPDLGPPIPFRVAFLAIGLVVFAISAVSANTQPSNQDAAVQALEKLHCPMSDSSTLTQVQGAWRERQQQPVADDDLVRTLLAKCLIEANQTRQIPEALISSAVAWLRTSLQSPDIRVVITGLSGMRHFATPDDVDKILKIAMSRPDLATAAVASLCLICLPEAAFAIAQIRTAYAGTRQSKSIENLIAQQKADAGSTSCSEKQHQ